MVAEKRHYDPEYAVWLEAMAADEDAPLYASREHAYETFRKEVRGE